MPLRGGKSHGPFVAPLLNLMVSLLTLAHLAPGSQEGKLSALTT